MNSVEPSLEPATSRSSHLKRLPVHRILNTILFLLMLLFVMVQFNDPDGWAWMLIYAIPAVWTAIAAFRPAALSKSTIRGLLVCSVLGAIIGLLYFWPTSEGWWRQEVWWETETAREGMGMMIVFVVLLFVWLGNAAQRGRAKPR